MSSIRIHPEFGMNPTMPVCRWCDQPTGQIALLGASYEKEAPMHMVLNDNPCDKCKANMAQGLTIIEMPEGYAGKSLAERTGRWCVMSWEGAEHMLNDDMLTVARSQKVMLIHPSTANKLGIFDQELPEVPSEKDAN